MEEKFHYISEIKEWKVVILRVVVFLNAIEHIYSQWVFNVFEKGARIKYIETYKIIKLSEFS